MPHRTKLAAAAAAVALLAPAALAEDDDAVVAPPAEAPRHEIDILYNGYFLGLRVLKAGVTGSVSDGDYRSEAIFRTAGLAGMFKEAQITATGNGRYDGQGVEPAHFQHHNSASKKNRRISIDWTGDDVIPTVTPPFGSMGQPPATREEKLGSRDVASTILSMTLDGGDAPCTRTLPVFDGKQRYDLRMEQIAYEEIDVRGYEGPGWRCNIYYTPVSGFDPEDLADPEDYARPMEIWLADLGEGRTPPVMIHGRVSGINVSVEAKSIAIQSGDGLRAASDVVATDGG